MLFFSNTHQAILSVTQIQTEVKEQWRMQCSQRGSFTEIKKKTKKKQRGTKDVSLDGYTDMTCLVTNRFEVAPYCSHQSRYTLIHLISSCVISIYSFTCLGILSNLFGSPSRSN